MICRRHKTNVSGWIIEITAIKRGADTDQALLQNVDAAISQQLHSAAAAVSSARGLADLSIDELKTIIDAHGIDTSARTASGLRRAVERFYEQ